MGWNFIYILFILLFSINSYAENLKYHAKYVDSIVYDEEEKRILTPAHIFVDSVMKEIYVISQGKIIVYSSEFFPLLALDKSRGIETPQGVAVDSQGNLYVSQSMTKDNPKHRISVYDPCLRWQRDIYLEGFEGAEAFMPQRLAVDKQNNIYVTGSHFQGVLILDKEGKFTGVLSPEEEGEKVYINSVTIDEIGRIYLVSEDKGRVYVYDENKKFIFKFGQKGGSTGKLSRPQAIGVDNKNKRMYIVDYMRHTISVYDENGKYLFEFGGLGWSEGWFQYPTDVAVDSDGKVLIADMFNDRIQIFEIQLK
ncbi:MAG: NHL repeat-containing protein [Candidatus Aenigmatarchaeota archaeon]